MPITDFGLRKVPRKTRRELFSYVPRTRLLGMDQERFVAVMEAHGRPDLARATLDALGGGRAQAGPGRGAEGASCDAAPEKRGSGP